MTNAQPGPRFVAYTHTAGRLHDPGKNHPERAARLDAVMDALAEFGSSVEIREAPLVDPADLEGTHSLRYLEFLNRLDAAGGGSVDRDTWMGPHSYEAAKRACGAATDAIRTLKSGQADSAFVAMRPPGHHATFDGPISQPNWTNRTASMGFCLLNAAAAAAAYAISHDYKRVAIVDWDAHHGNGTQDIFWTNPNVLYASTHQAPFYPGTGNVDEIGGDDGRGMTVNVPLPAGSAGDVYARAFDEIICPKLEQFEPGLIVVSAGADADRRDPICDMRLTAGAFGRFTERLLRFGVPLLFVLEGGYDLDALALSTRAIVGTCLGLNLSEVLPQSEITDLVGTPEGHVWVERALGSVT